VGPDLDHEQFGLWFASAQVGYVAMAHGGEGFLDKTTNGGHHWAPVAIPRELSAVRTVWFADEQHGWLGPLWGTPVMARTDDGGQTWKMLDLRPTLKGKADNPNNWQHLGFWAWDRDHVLLAGDKGLILRTADGGATWQATAGPDLAARAVSFCDREHGLMVGPAGATARTGDGGATWEAVPSGAPNDLTAVACVSPTEGWATGMAVYKGAPSYTVAGCLLHTTDGGRTWKNASPVGSGLRSVFFLDAKHGWAVGGAGGSASEPSAMVLRYWQP
jgi:photosystem II stability/assembly factor-like uncharacterized protein